MSTTAGLLGPDTLNKKSTNLVDSTQEGAPEPRLRRGRQSKDMRSHSILDPILRPQRSCYQACCDSQTSKSQEGGQSSPDETTDH